MACVAPDFGIDIFYQMMRGEYYFTTVSLHAIIITICSIMIEDNLVTNQLEWEKRGVLDFFKRHFGVPVLNKRLMFPLFGVIYFLLASL